MTSEQEVGLHEKLCAYVLGEADAATRAEVERELAASAELRAERANIEATIGLVKGAIGGEEALSAEKTAEILSAANRPPKPIAARRPWYASPAMKMAAGLSAVALGYIAFQAASKREAPASAFEYHLFGGVEEAAGADDQFAKKRSEQAGGEMLAAASKDAGTYVGPGDSVPPGASPSDLERFKSLGYAGDEAAEATAPTGPKNEKADAFVAALDAVERGDPSYYYENGVRQNDARDQKLGLDTSAVAKEEAQGLDWAPTGGTAIGVGSGGHRGTAKSQDEFAQRPGEALLTGESASNAPVASSPPVLDAETAAELKEASRRALNTRASGAGPSGPGPSTPGPAVRDALQGLGYAGGDRDEAPELALRGRLAGSDDFHLGAGLKRKGNVEDRLYFPTIEERDRYLDDECRRIVTWCRPRPNERPRDMFFRFWGDNAFEFASLDAQSTFSVDVDTASYALARRYLDEGHVPTKAQVRTEEFVNYFKPDVAAPVEGTFAIHTDLAPSRFSADQPRWLMRVVVRGREVSKQERKPLALTFVVDTSGSMREQNRLEMVKHALRLLVGELDANDTITIVSFSNDARLILPPTSARNRGLIESAIHPLAPQSSTNAEAGLRMGYESALASLNPNATNRVVFLSDGVANTGQTDQDRINESVKFHRERGIYLNTIGVGMNNHNDVLLEQLADNGDGVCNYIDTAAEAKRVLVDGFTGAFEPIARDVKVQVEFDPAQVYRYRLLGYENRAVADVDFRNDKIDAGEVGAGHQVTALYEIERTSQTGEKPLATVRLRWKQPRVAGLTRAVEKHDPRESPPQLDRELKERMDAAREAILESATEIAQPVLASQATSFEGAGVGYRRAVIVAQFAEFLRRSVHARQDSFDELIAEAQKLERELDDADFKELVRLVVRAKDLVLSSAPVCDDLCQSIDILRRNEMLRAEYDSLKIERDAKLLEDLERQNREIEERIREELRKRAYISGNR